MTSTSKQYCIILAGGKGRRLWPSSREERPKQFVDFFGTGQTQLQQTFERMARIVPESHIFVNTNAAYADLAREQLPSLPADHLLVEPIHRNTAPGTTWGFYRISRFCHDAAVVVVPSDQTVINEAAFARNLHEGFEFVDCHQCFLSFGVTPTRPEPGYGYIQMGQEEASDLFRVKAFTEKPEREFAEMLIQSGEFLWNTGIYMSTVSHVMQAFGTLLPPVLRQFDQLKPTATIAEENEYMRENFSLYPNVSVDYAILEKQDDVCVMRCDFGWADLGTWHSLYEAMHKAEGDNVVVDSQVIIDDSHGCVVKLPEGKRAVISGLNDYIVADSDNVLLICKRQDSSSMVKKYVNEVHLKWGEEYV